MNRIAVLSGRFRPRLLALLAVCLVPAGAVASELQVRNETPTCVVFQAACVVQGTIMRDPPQLLRAGESSTPIRLPGNKLITIYDARTPNLTLYRGAVPASEESQFYVIVKDPDRPNRVKLVQTLDIATSPPK